MTGAAAREEASTDRGRPPLVSVIMPIFDCAHDLLGQAVKSILAQKLGDLELVIVEDPSPRLAGPLVKSFGDARIRYSANLRRTGFSEQLNRCIELARTDMIARMDGDDVAEPERIAVQYSFLQQHPEVDLVGSNIAIIDGAGRKIGKRCYPEGAAEIAAAMRSFNAVAHPTVMFRKAKIVAAGGFKPEYGVLADYDLWCRLVIAGACFHNLQVPLLQYRIHGSASKIRGLKQTLHDTLAIKRRYFRGRDRSWGWRESMRYWLEALLILTPPRLVLWLFMKTVIGRASRP